MKKPAKSAVPMKLPPKVEQAGDMDGAILDLLSRLPLTWEPLDPDKLTAVQQEALKLLAAGGLVERRFVFRLSLIGHAVNIEATITATGEYGIVEALEPVAKAAWQAWAGDYLKSKAGGPQDQPTFLCERTGLEQARLTQEGQQARQDAATGQVRMVLDFLHRRTPRFAGQIVRGRGRAEAVHSQTAAHLVKVEIADTGPMAAIANVMQKWFAMQEKALVTDIPADLITTEVATIEFHASKATIRRKVKAGELRDYRKPGSATNSKLLLSRSELGRLFARRRS